jgi:hypothetical protein
MKARYGHWRIRFRFEQNVRTSIVFRSVIRQQLAGNRKNILFDRRPEAAEQIL